ncbi:MAG: hypothetical protein H3C35_07515 [Bacteroidetes bacterium]|nr:hypothetical protein [Bacteroidota bacterium]
MNNKQKIPLWIAIGFILLTLIFPPFVIYNKGQIGVLEYSFILKPPSSYSTVDIELLLTQWLGILIVSAIAFFLFKDNRGDK